AHVFLPIHAFFHPDAVVVNDFLFRIGKKREGQLILGDELLVARRRVDAYPENLRATVEFAPSITQPAGLRGTSRRGIFRIKIEDDRPAAELRQPNESPGSIFSADCGGGEVWRRIADGEDREICGHFSKRIISTPTAHNKRPITAASYFSKERSLTCSIPVRARPVKATMPAIVPTVRMIVRRAKPCQP